MILQCGINVIASWMTLKRSKIKNFLSWRINTILKYFPVSSVSCHCAVPHFIRPLLRVHKIVPKIIFQSPEFNRFIIFSRQIIMTKQSDQLLRHCIIDGRKILWFKIGPIFYPLGTIFAVELAEMSLSFFFSLWSAREIKCIRFKRTIFELHIRGFLHVVVVLLVDQVCDQLVRWMIKSDQRVRIVFVYRLNSDFHSVFTLQTTGCDFQYGSNFDVLLNPTFRVKYFSYLGKMNSRQATETVNCESSLGSFAMKYSLTSIVVKNLISIQNLITRSCCDNLSTCSWYLCNNLLLTQDHRSEKCVCVCVSSWHLTKTMGQIVLSKQVALF